MTLKEIQAPLNKHLDKFNVLFRETMKSRAPLLNTITRYIVKPKGKQMRPLFVFLSAELCGEISEKTYRAAALIELLHTATLIHDDVVDDSNERRGFFSLNALWKNKISVLVGDYLLSRGMLLSVENNDHDLLKIVSNSVKVMSEGELLQMEKARKLDIKEEIYFEIIRQKTASLIASCFACGAASAGASEEIISKLYSIGENIGMAFQIKDDLIDLENTKRSGKPSGVDIKERKLTLPLIFLLNNSSYLEKRKILRIVKKHNHNEEKVDRLITLVKEKGGIDYAEQKMDEYKNLAISGLNMMPECKARESLKALVEFTITRSS
ncbi:MAG: polyprenyl synthetase family protein [Bacteroidetes bacterium]|nr:polyprenyl synthetase family protein [Bacteroidota bacterium]